MKIIQVISLLDPEMSFGGPTRVALNQLKALQEAGHEVLLVAGVQGFDARTMTDYDGIPVKAFKAHRLPGIGFAGLFAPGMLRWLARVPLGQDQVHIHLARDLVSAPAGWLLTLRGQRFVAQTHGMIDASERLSAKVLDAVMLRRLLRRASPIFALTEKEQNDLKSVEPRLANIRILPNGVGDSAFQVNVGEPAEVLFLARLQERKRPLEFIRASRQLLEEFPTVLFTLAGPDGGAKAAVLTELAEDDGAGRIRLVESVAPENVRQRMSSSSVYVLPSFNEPFPMTVLEAMSTGVSVVVMDDCGLAPLVKEAGGEVVGYADGELVAGIRRFLADDQRRRQFALDGPALLRQQYGMGRVVAALLDAYGAPARKKP